MPGYIQGKLKQEANGPHRSRETFPSNKQPGAILQPFPFLEGFLAFHLNKLESPSLKDTLIQVWLKLTQSFWKKKILIVFSVFSLFHYYLLLAKDLAL